MPPRISRMALNPGWSIEFIVSVFSMHFVNIIISNNINGLIEPKQKIKKRQK